MLPEFTDVPLTMSEEYAVLSRRSKLERSKRAYRNYENASPARKKSMRNYRNLIQYRTVQQQFLAASQTVMQQEDYEALLGILERTKNHIANKSKTYTVCPSCYGALKGRQPTKAFKSFTNDTCVCCGAKAYGLAEVDGIRPSNLHIRHTLTREEAITEVHTNHPELFI